MKYQLTREQLEEMVFCIVDCNLNRDDAFEYAQSVISEFNAEDAEVIWPESDERIDAIGANGGDGAHYSHGVKS